VKHKKIRGANTPPDSPGLLPIRGLGCGPAAGRSWGSGPWFICYHVLSTWFLRL